MMATSQQASFSQAQFMVLECFKFIITYSVASYYPKTLFLCAIWLIKVAQEYVSIDSSPNNNSTYFSKNVCQTTSKEIAKFKNENIQEEKLSENESLQRTSGVKIRCFESKVEELQESNCADFFSISQRFKDTKEFLNIPLNNLGFNQSVERKKKKKKKLNIVSPHAENKEYRENEIKKPKEHDWEFGSDDSVEMIENVVAYLTLLTFMVQNKKIITRSPLPCITPSRPNMADNILNNPPSDGNGNNSKNDDRGRKQNSECAGSQNVKPSKCCQTRTGSAGIGGHSGSNGEDEDDENRQPKKWNTCNKDVFFTVEKEEEHKPEPTAAATDINIVAEQQEKCQSVIAEQLPNSAKAVLSSDYLKSSFQCKENTCNISAWKGCEDQHCQKLCSLMMHSHSCVERIIGDCQTCLLFAHDLYDHAKGCDEDDCAVDRCQIIKDHIASLETFPAQKWNSKLEDIFFNPIKPHVQFQATHCQPVDTNSLFPLIQSEMSDEVVSFYKKKKRDQEVKKRKPPEIGSSNYLHETEQLGCFADVDRPPTDVGFSSTQISSSSPVGTGTVNNVRLLGNQDIPLKEENIENLTSSLLNSVQCECRSKVVAEELLHHRKNTKGDHVQHPIAVRGQVTLPRPEKLEREALLGLASNTAENRQQITSEQVPQSQGQKDDNDETILWPLNPVYLSVVDGQYKEYRDWFTSPDRYIGGGANSRCFVGIDNQTSKQFAIKRIPIEKFDISELKNWGMLSGGPNILELYGAIKRGKQVIIFMELMEGGSVEDVIDGQEDSGYGDSEVSSDDSSQMSGSLPEGLSMYVIGEVLKALKYMHSKNVMHRDIKGANILLDDTYQIVKVGDFGEAVDLTNRESQRENAPRGTEAFMAPEVCRSEDHSFSADIWSLMCTLYQMLTGQPPWMAFRHNSILYQIAISPSPPELPKCSPQIKDFFERGFKLKSDERETAVELLKHPGLQLGYEYNGASLRVKQTSDCSTGYSSEEELGDCCLEDQSGSEEEKAPSQPVRTSTPASLEGQLDHLSLGPLSTVASEGNEDFFLSDLEDSNGTGSPPFNPDVALSDRTPFSLTDLTKIHVVSPTGAEIFIVRQSSTVLYEELAERLREKVANETGLKTFKLVDLDGTPLVAGASLGYQEQWLKVQSSP